MCDKCRAYIPDDERAHELEDIISEAYKAGAQQVDDIEWQGNSALQTLLVHIFETAKKAEHAVADEFNKGERNLQSMMHELDQIKSEMLVLAMWAGAYLERHPNFELKTWECDDFMNAVQPCGHTNREHKSIDGFRKNAEHN